MLVLSRKPGEKIVVSGRCVITFVESRGNKATIGVSAEDGVEIVRGELVERRGREAKEGLDAAG